MKIKRKVEMTHEEYAKYMIDKYGVSGFESELIDDNIIDAPKRFTLAFELNPVPKSDLLNGSFRSGKITVEVEEVVDEDTVFEEILLIVNNGLGIEVYSNYSINDVLSNNEGYYEETVMLILKPDPEVIWTREKGLVE